MPHRRRPPLLALLMLVSMSAAGPAWSNTAVLTATCRETGTELTVDLDVETPVPALWAGWVVDRMTIGPCENLQPVFGPVAFPEGAGSWSFDDPSARPGIAYKYLLWAVDASGNRYDFTDETFVDRWTAETYTTCRDASAVRGGLGGSDGGRTWMFVCGDGSVSCWEYVSYVENLPVGLQPLVGTDTVVELIGALHMGPEGPYITDVTGWLLPGACEAVATSPITWGRVKASFR